MAVLVYFGNYYYCFVMSIVLSLRHDVVTKNKWKAKFILCCSLSQRWWYTCHICSKGAEHEWRDIAKATNLLIQSLLVYSCRHASLWSCPFPEMPQNDVRVLKRLTQYPQEKRNSYCQRRKIMAVIPKWEPGQVRSSVNPSNINMTCTDLYWPAHYFHSKQ